MDTMHTMDQMSRHFGGVKTQIWVHKTGGEGGVAGQITIRFRRVFPQRTGQAGSHHFRRQIHSPPQVTKVSTCPYGHIPVTPCTVHSCAGMDIPAVHNTGLLPDPVQGDRLRYICWLVPMPRNPEMLTVAICFASQFFTLMVKGLKLIFRKLLHPQKQIFPQDS